MTNELKPTAWADSHDLAGKQGSFIVAQYKHITGLTALGITPRYDTALYAIPPTHRVVSVELLDALANRDYFTDEFSTACDKANAIIDNKGE